MDLGLLNLRPGASREEIIKVYNDAVLRIKKYVFNQEQKINELHDLVDSLGSKIDELQDKVGEDL